MTWVSGPAPDQPSRNGALRTSSELQEEETPVRRWRGAVLPSNCDTFQPDDPQGPTVAEIGRRPQGRGASDKPGRARTAGVGRTLIGQAEFPLVSGKGSVGVLVGCFALTALLIPVALRLPAWIEAQLVLVAWWLTWTGALTLLLVTGRGVADDRPDMERTGPDDARSWWGSLAFPEFDGGNDAGWAGVVAITLGVLLLIVILVAAWFLILVAIPVLALVGYFLVGGMLAQVANRPHACRGRPLRALAHGAFWASVYTMPLALGVWAVHLLANRPPA
jgi:hypothetical protein